MPLSSPTEIIKNPKPFRNAILNVLFIFSFIIFQLFFYFFLFSLFLFGIPVSFFLIKHRNPNNKEEKQNGGQMKSQIIFILFEI